MSITFYFAPNSSASPVASALTELGVPHERVTFDFSKKAHKQPEYLKINPNGFVPALTVDGAPMFEALAILLWLGDTFGIEKGLWPRRDEPSYLQAYSWCTWAYVTYGSMLSRFVYSSSDAVDPRLRNSAQAEHAAERLDELLQLLDNKLSQQPYLLGSNYSLADLVVASVVGYSVWMGAPVAGHSHVQAWLADFQARPAFASGMAA